jgi:hypothetical protein
VVGTVDKLIEAKQNLNRSGKLFSHAVGQSDADALRQAIKKKMYLNLVDAIGELSPEIKALNHEGKRLLDVNAALSNAASRVSNHDAMGLTDFVLGGASIAHPGSLAATAPLFIAKKSLGNGRAGNMLIRAGRGLQGKRDRTIGETLRKTAEMDRKIIPKTAYKTSGPVVPKNSETPAYLRIPGGISNSRPLQNIIKWQQSQPRKFQ